MATVLITWELGGGLGHCVKLAPLAAELVARGHTVYFAARDVATAQKVLQNPAVKFLQSPCLLARPAGVLQNPRTFGQVLDQVGFCDDRQLRALVESWRNLFELVRPDLIVCEHSPSALVASRWTDARRVVVGTGFSLPPDVSPLPDLCPWMGQSAVNLVHHEIAILDRANELLVADGLTPLDRLSQLYSEVDDAFLMTFRELDHHPNRGPAEYLGSWTPSTGIEPEWPSGSGPHVFAYLKSAASPLLLERALAVLRELPVKTLAYVPRASKNILALQSPSLRISREPVNIAAALQRCDLALLNGTAGTATQCLLTGVPAVMLPLYLEQIIFSRRVGELGAGLMCAPNRTELLAGRIWHVLQDDRFRRAARALADRYAAYDPLATQHQITDRIEALLEATAK
jgi:UDP:flavonoid glycosyltransferase YjiC (YdhE family)